MSLSISLIVAVSKNGVIGLDGSMPWHLTTDLKRFKALTVKHPVIMGRKTFVSIGRPLPDRCNIVVSRNPDFQYDGVTVQKSLNSALDYASEVASANGSDAVFIIGGGDIFKQALPLAQKMFVTEVLADINGDTFFPKFDVSQWKIIHEEKVSQGEKDSHDTRFVVYQRNQ